jgi:hypothetical protein
MSRSRSASPVSSLDVDSSFESGSSMSDDEEAERVRATISGPPATEKSVRQALFAQSFEMNDVDPVGTRSMWTSDSDLQSRKSSVLPLLTRNHERETLDVWGQQVHPLEKAGSAVRSVGGKQSSFHLWQEPLPLPNADYSAFSKQGQRQFERCNGYDPTNKQKAKKEIKHVMNGPTTTSPQEQLNASVALVSESAMHDVYMNQTHSQPSPYMDTSRDDLYTSGGLNPKRNSEAVLLPPTQRDARHARNGQSVGSASTVEKRVSVKQTRQRDDSHRKVRGMPSSGREAVVSIHVKSLPSVSSEDRKIGTFSDIATVDTKARLSEPTTQLATEFVSPAYVDLASVETAMRTCDPIVTPGTETILGTYVDIASVDAALRLTNSIAVLADDAKENTESPLQSVLTNNSQLKSAGKVTVTKDEVQTSRPVAASLSEASKTVTAGKVELEGERDVASNHVAASNAENDGRLTLQKFEENDRKDALLSVARPTLVDAKTFLEKALVGATFMDEDDEEVQRVLQPSIVVQGDATRCMVEVDSLNDDVTVHTLNAPTAVMSQVHARSSVTSNRSIEVRQSRLVASQKDSVRVRENAAMTIRDDDHETDRTNVCVGVPSVFVPPSSTSTYKPDGDKENNRASIGDAILRVFPVLSIFRGSADKREGRLPRAAPHSSSGAVCLSNGDRVSPDKTYSRKAGGASSQVDLSRTKESSNRKRMERPRVTNFDVRKNRQIEGHSSANKGAVLPSRSLGGTFSSATVPVARRLPTVRLSIDKLVTPEVKQVSDRSIASVTVRGDTPLNEFRVTTPIIPNK